MKDIKKITLGGIAAILILSILSCSSPAQLFATSTPVPSDTPTKTLTPSPTATSAPPIYLSGCVYNDCPASKTIPDYIGDVQIQPNVVTTVKIPWADTVHVFTAWCAKGKTALDTSLSKVQFIFTIDDVSYLGVLKGEYYENPDPQDASVTQYCYGMGGVASGWKIGQSHMIKIGVEITADTNDGWSDYPAGSSYPYLYMIIPSELPTETPRPSPTPTNTDTPLPPPPPPPAATSTPGAPPPPAVSCLVNSNIIISNRSDGYATLNLTGPGNFTFYLALDANTVLVCAGSYDYTIYGTCNGSPASGSGRISDGDNIYFYCN